MPTIAEDDTFTQVVEFEVASDRQAALIAAIVGEVERWMCRRPGFVFSTFHASHDGTRVINYAQRRSEGEFHAFTADPGNKEIWCRDPRRWHQGRAAGHALPGGPLGRRPAGARQ